MPSGSFQVTLKLVGQEDNKEIPGAGHAVFAKCGSGGVAISNHLIIADITSYLEDRELEHWYESFRNFRHIIDDQMAQVCWRKQALRLANILEDIRIIELDDLEEKWPNKSSREICHILEAVSRGLVQYQHPQGAPTGHSLLSNG